jgi:hypothetical protein
VGGGRLGRRPRKPSIPNDDAPDPNAAFRALAAPEPAAEPDPKVLLDHIAEVSRNASAT